MEILGVDYNNFRKTTAPAIYLLRLEKTRSRSIVFLVAATGSIAGNVRSTVKIYFFKSDDRCSNGDNILKKKDSDKINKRYDSRTSRSIQLKEKSRAAIRRLEGIEN